MTSAIIVAAGASRRMGFDKLLAPLGGRPVVLHSVQRFESCAAISEIVLVVNVLWRTEIEPLVRGCGFRKVIQIVTGGAERHLSVWEGLKHLSPQARIVAVHDAARPLVTSAAIARAVAGAQEYGAVSLAAPVVDTLKRADDSGAVSGNIDRAGLWAMQTPQVFRRDWLNAAYEMIIARGKAVSDEVSAVQAAGFPVRLLANSEWNIKITYPRDLDLAEKLMHLEKV
jgi:2-C-methyl-D-erythritol 4-phosphate cytidylyltransferase